MSNPRFTPGPWKWWTSNSWRRLSSEHREHPREGAVLCPFVSRADGHPDVSISQEDMALIGAAPELYDALADIISIFDQGIDSGSLSCSDYTANEVLRDARAALARARGEQP